VNLAETLADRHAASGRMVLHWEGRDGTARSFTFAELAEASSRHANMLRGLGIGKGDRVGCILPRVPEAIIAMLGAFRLAPSTCRFFLGLARKLRRGASRMRARASSSPMPMCASGCRNGGRIRSRW
jgi:acyl-coenzyme A synthetase/AMP-(fatty) acid ligase